MANLNLNKVILCGRLTAAPELRQTPSGVMVTSFTVAINRRFSSRNEDGQGTQQQADFINVTAWRQSAEFVCKYFQKGSSICVVGSIQTRSWTDQQGTRHYATEVVADEVSFVESKGDAPAGGNNTQYTPDAYGAPAYTGGNTASFEEMPADDSLPF